MDKSTKFQEPIAIIGIGCHLAGGVSSPDSLWNLLVNKGDGIIDVPQDRWDKRRFYDPNGEKPGKMYVNQAGFLQEDISAFDPLFFGISPRETPNIDPQQRLLLETTYEAIEDAGLQLEALRGRDVGVFIGGFFLDFKLLQLSPFNREAINMHTGTGLTMVVLSNRISYTFDLKGPSVSMDTACSSSLIAIHTACRSIWNGESSLAITGGVHVMLRPEPFIALSAGHFLSHHARCKAFDEDAAGYVRSEGAGILILKSYQQALQDNDPIYALIKATGANQDGQTPGITVPNPLSQETLMRKIYTTANIDINDIHYVEAHGTGTQAGDPAEMQALDAVLSEGRRNGEKVLVGSIKTNIGHSEAVAGVAGVMKAALCLKHKQVPPNLHFSAPNPKLNYEQRCLKVATQIEELPKDRLSYACVNSFGYGGTNAHVVLQEVPQTEKNAASSLETITVEHPFEQKQPLFILPVTTRSEDALHTLAKQYAGFIREEQPSLQDLLYTTVFRKSHYQHRLAVVGESAEQLADQLQSFAEGQLLRGMAVNQARIDEKPRLVFVFTGMGPQWWAMGRELLEQEPVFRQVIEDGDRVFRQYAGWSILEEMLKDEETSRIAETQIAQPANFMIQAALTELWKTYGIEPAAIVGHSVGEVTASCASGSLSWEDAILVSFHRGRLQQQIAGQGKLLAVGMSESEALELLTHFEEVSIAAINSPRSVTLSGAEEHLEKIAAVLEHRQVFNRMLRVEIPYHSHFMDPIQADILESLNSIRPQKEKIPVYSTVTTERMQGTDFGAEYWQHNVRKPVRFAKTIENILNDGYSLFLEVGPHPVLRRSLQECFQETGKQGQVFASLKRKEPELFNIYETLATLYTIGFEINWQRLATGGAYIKLPGYPWQKDRYEWNETEFSKQDRLGLSGHAFCNMKLPTPQIDYEVELNTLFFPFLKDHQVSNMVVFPGAAYIESGLALASQENGGETPCTLENLEFRGMLVIDENRVQTLHIHLDPQTRKYGVHSKFKEEQAQWSQHASGRILAEPLAQRGGTLPVHELKARCTQQLSVEQFYNRLDRIGLKYLPHFRTVKELYQGDQELIARIEGHESLASNSDIYFLHPTILDGAIQTLAAFSEKLMVPVIIGRINYYSSPGTHCWSYLKFTETTENSIKGDLCLFDESGRICAELQDLECRRVVREDADIHELLDNWLYEMAWNETEMPATGETSGKWLVFAEDNDQTRQLLNQVRSQQIACTLITHGTEYQEVTEHHIQLPFNDFAAIQRVIDEREEIPIHVVLWTSHNRDQGERIDVTSTIEGCMPVIYLAQAWARIRSSDDVKFSIVTCHAQFVTDEDTGRGIVLSPLWGLGRLISNEHPNITCKLIDIDGDASEQEIQFLVNELLSDNTDEDVAFRTGTRFVKTLQHTSLRKDTKEKASQQVFTHTTPVELVVGTIGKIESLYYQETERRKVQSGEVEVQVHSVPLNFKDVMEVLGHIPAKLVEDPHLTHALGLECCGTVSKVGEGVTDYQVGDEVVISSPTGSFRSYITVAQDGYIHPKPAHMKPGEASMVVPFMAAAYGLGHIANLQPREKILIHNASGGVGLAAVQYARWKGAEIFATAGNQKKRNYLQSLGIEHVMDSRTLEFAKTIREVTHGYGVDVVLSGVSGEALSQSFALLAPYGRFIEIGKRDTSEHISFPMQVFNRNITFATLDIDLVHQHEQLGKQLWREVFQGFEHGYFTPLPVTVFPAADAVDAFTHLAHSEHIGRVVLNFYEQPIDISEEKIATVIKPDATYLITGGTRGFGLEIGKWLSSQGAGQLVLISRSGATTEEARNAITEMEARGTQVLAAAVDISDEQEVQQLVQRIVDTMPPLRGIFHGAMVLDDGYLLEMNEERLRRVMLPKVAGALHLHHFTHTCPLDFFISFSSISSLIGNPGQTNYVAANTFLDTFAPFRRHQGLPATTVNLGVLAEVGVASRHADVKSQLEGAGIKGFTTEQALQALEVIMEQTPVQIGLFDVDWNLWAEHNPGSAALSRFHQLVKRGEAGKEISEKLLGIMAQMVDMQEQDKRQYLQSLVSAGVGKVLRLPAEKISVTKPLMEQGVDSLLTVEMRNHLKESLGLTLPETFLFAYPTVEKLSGYILEKVLVFETPQEEEQEDDTGSEALKELDELLESLE